MTENPPAMWEPWVRSWVGKISWRRAWQPTPVFLPWESPWTEEPGGLQSMGSQRVRQNWATNQSATNKDLLYSAENSAPHYVTTWMGREFGKNRCKSMYNWITLLYAWNEHSIVSRLDSNIQWFFFFFKERNIEGQDRNLKWMGKKGIVEKRLTLWLCENS